MLGGAIITVVLLVVEIVTGLAESGVALEFAAAGLMHVLKATGKLGLDAVREHSAALCEGALNVAKMGKGAFHGAPRFAEGVGEVIRGHGLPPEFSEAIV